MIAIMEENHAVVSAGIPVGTHQRAQSAQERIGGRQRIFLCAGRADRSSASAARADIGIDCDMIARGRNRAGRADFETTRAADNARARMGAKIGMEINETRLVELADEMACLEQYALDRRRIARVGAQIPASQIVRSEQRRAAGKIEDEIAARCRSIASRTKNEARLRRRRGNRVIVDAQLEGAEMALGADDRPLQHRKLIGAARRDLTWSG